MSARVPEPHRSGPRVTAAVLAGGVGLRMGSDRPKQLLPLAGRPIIEHAIAAFNDAPEVDDVIVLMADDFVPEVEKIVADGAYRKVSRVLAGGGDRSETSWKALRALEAAEGDELVLLHDAVRPLVSPAIIGACVAELREATAVGVAVQAGDTVVEVTQVPPAVAGEADSVVEVITSVPSRASLRRMQTPQGFRLDIIRRAYQRAMADPDLVATDDCGVVLRYLPEVEVRIVAGEERNIKVTHPGDLPIAEALLAPPVRHR